MILRPRRSALYMPGSNARALEKAKSLPADILIFDLEDAVSPDSKVAARDQVVAAVRQGGYGNREITVRVNAPDTPWGKDDLAAVAEAGPDAILVPKISTPGDIMMAAKCIREGSAPDRTRLWAMMETPLAILNADSIARTGADPASRLSLLVMGTNDIAKDTRARLTPGRLSMLAYLSICVAAARAHGLEILDGVYNDFSNDAGFKAECEQGRDFGMDGKTLIHPNQVATANAIFAPADEEIAWAQKVITVFETPENRTKGAVQVEGRMVERMHAEMAQRTVALARAIAARA
ncbi:MAG: citrate lyase subunit beta / citryl-CoA lyase [Methylobacteriaceae bacterium]|nr:citrate lyase subunit beta / citryl-CoA lyase [Methylobacteriaceae bacterium]